MPLKKKKGFVFNCGKSHNFGIGIVFDRYKNPYKHIIMRLIIANFMLTVTYYCTNK